MSEHRVYRCPCGKHEIDTYRHGTDPYSAHANFLSHHGLNSVERGLWFSGVREAVGVGVSAPRSVSTVDEQWGEEFEIWSNDDGLRGGSDE